MITENYEFNELDLNERFYFDTNLQTESLTCKLGNISGCKYGWLYDRISINCKTYGCLNNLNIDKSYGYWTSTSRAGYQNQAYVVFKDSSMTFGNVTYSSNIGIRPVIEVLKNKL